jgi:peptidylprolyl isomerase
MTSKKVFCLDWCKRLLKKSVLVILLLALSLSLNGVWTNAANSEPARKSTLAAGNAITDPTAILRYALPIDNQTVRELQVNIEDISNHLRGKRWSPVVRDAKTAARILNNRADKLLASIPQESQSRAKTLIEEMTKDVNDLQEATETKDKERVWGDRRQLLDRLTKLEELMVQGFPFEVPSQYASLPQLLGRASVEIETTQGNMTVMVDGYSAPVNAGNFVDLVKRGFYDGLDFFALEGFVIQTGNPPGEQEGFIDPDTGEYRAIPLEVLVRGEEKPIYGITLEEAGIYLPDLALPFNAYGAVALASPSNDPNGGSSQFFFFKFDNELTPPGFNLMDGRYSVFGYVVKGKEVLEKLTDKDKIISAKVVDGIENLVEPTL